MSSPVDPASEHDAYLRSALRHAPDAALGPPAALDDAILRRARSATAETSPEATTRVTSARPASGADRSPAPAPWARRILRGLADGWSWLARPSVATGFAGVMVATLVGVMWWGRPLDEAMPRRFEPPAPTAPASTDSGPAPAANRSDPAVVETRPTSSGTTAAGSSAAERDRERLSATAPRTNAAPPGSRRSTPEAAAPAPSIATSPAMPDRLAKRQAEPSAFPTQADPPVDTRTRDLHAGLDRGARPESDASKARSAGAAGEPMAPPSPAAAPRSKERFEIAAPRAASPAASPPPPAMADAAPDSRGATSPAATPDPGVLQASRAAPERLTAAPAAPRIASPVPATLAAASRDAAASEATGKTDDRKVDRADAARGSGAMASNRVELPTRSPLAPLRTALAAEPGRWTWSADGRSVQRVTPALLAWLARLDAALAARPAESRPPEEAPGSDEDTAPAAAPTGPVRTLVLLHGGHRHTELRLGAALEVTPIDPPGPRWRATLAAEDARALRESLP